MIIVALIYLEQLTGSVYEGQVISLLEQADKEFIPPLSARGSTTQAQLTDMQSVSAGVMDYYTTMSKQPIILAVSDHVCVGFMSFKVNYHCLQTPAFPNLYASTCVVAPQARGQGLMKSFYVKMAEIYPTHTIFTRTWHTNHAHIRVLEKLGFALIARLKDHRGPGLDTVYYAHTANN